MPSRDESPWRQWREQRLRDSLPSAPDRLLSELRDAVDPDRTPFDRAQAMAIVLVEGRRWFDDFVARANELDQTYGLSPEQLLNIAERVVDGG